MRNIIVTISVCTCLFLTACVTAPVKIADVNKGFSPLPHNDTGRVLIGAYKIPKEETGVKTLLFLALLFGNSQTNRPVYLAADVYDVTDGIHYLGTLGALQNPFDIVNRWPKHDAGWLEFDAPPGKRTLMLTNVQGINRGGGVHTDFIEINVVPNKILHVTLSQYGFIRNPYFGIINISDEHYNFCSSLRETDEDKLHELISTHMSAYGINADAWDFANYCLALGQDVKVFTPTAEGLKRFDKLKDNVTEAYNKNYPAWKKQHEMPIGYDLMHVYEQKKEQGNPMTHVANRPIKTAPPVPSSERSAAFDQPLIKLDINSIKNPAKPDLWKINQLVVSSLVAKLKHSCITEVNGFAGLRKSSNATQDDAGSFIMDIRPESPNAADNIHASMHSATGSTSGQSLWNASIPFVTENPPTNVETARKIAAIIFELMTKDKLIASSCN